MYSGLEGVPDESHTDPAPVSLNILSLRVSKVPSSLYGSYENLRLKMFG